MDYINDLVEKLIKYRESYYNGNPLITDEEFDALEHKLYLCDPNNEYFTLIGGKDMDSDDKVIHKIPMLSMQKVKNAGDAENWLFKLYNRYMNDTPQNEWFCYYEPKIDGVSGTIKYNKNGNLEYMATRGKGVSGYKIPFHEDLIKNKVIPAKIDNEYGKKEGFEIRGEFFIPKNITPELTEDKPLRNITSGIIKSKEKNENLKYLRFIAYDIVYYDKYHHDIETLNKLLKKFGFFTEPKKIIHCDDISKVYISYLDKFRNEWPFITDGLVLTFPHTNLWSKIDDDFVVQFCHHYNMALKPPAQYAYTTIKDVYWNISRYGNLIPVGILEPVNISNTNISRVTLVSAGYMETNRVGKGSTIKIERSNDVIPHILEVAPFPKIKVKIPNKCPACDQELIREGDHIKCINKECSGRVKAEIVHWFETLGIKGLGKETISKIVDKFNITSITNFYDVIINKEFEDLFSENSEKTKDNIYNLVKKSLIGITELDILSCVGIESIGPKSYKKLGIYDIASFEKFIKTLEKDIKDMKKVRIPVIEEKMLKWANNNDNMIKLKSLVKYFKPVSNIPYKEKEGKNICVTGSFEGYTRKDIEKIIENKGDNFMNTVTKNTHYLINDDGIQMGKYTKALELNIPIISLKEYMSKK